MISGIFTSYKYNMIYNSISMDSCHSRKVWDDVALSFYLNLLFVYLIFFSTPIKGKLTLSFMVSILGNNEQFLS